MAEAIRVVVTDRAYATTSRERGRARAETFTWEAAADQTAAVYRELVAMTIAVPIVSTERGRAAAPLASRPSWRSRMSRSSCVDNASTDSTAEVARELGVSACGASSERLDFSRR